MTSDQQSALEALRSGRNVVLTGDAGTGKSFLIDAFLDECEAAGKNYLAMSPTGVAALNLRGGSTIHRTLGIAPEFLDPREPVGLPRKILKEADLIVIDEFSMCRIDLFERVARMILVAEKATSRKQVVMVGDPFQLPPVVTDSDIEMMMERYPRNTGGYCYLSRYWRNFSFEPHILREVIRQRDDRELSRQLAAARVGDASCIPYFNGHSTYDMERADPDALWLCPRNSTANNINRKRLDAIPGRICVFKARCEGRVGKGDRPTDDSVELKVGARVMSVANDSLGRYANGSLGTVVGIEQASPEPVRVRFDNDVTVSIGRKSWEIKKSVLKPDGVDEKTGKPKNRIVSETIGVFDQIPLRLAYAITIHKAQGQSYEKVNIDTRVFERSQLYVALSRATTFDGITVYPKIEPGRLRPNDAAIAFFDSLVERERIARADTGSAVRLLDVGRCAPDGYDGIAVPHAMLEDVLKTLSGNGYELSSECRGIAGTDDAAMRLPLAMPA